MKLAGYTSFELIYLGTGSGYGIQVFQDIPGDSGYGQAYWDIINRLMMNYFGKGCGNITDSMNYHQIDHDVADAFESTGQRYYDLHRGEWI